MDKAAHTSLQKTKGKTNMTVGTFIETKVVNLDGMSLDELRHSQDPGLVACMQTVAQTNGPGILQNQLVEEDGTVSACSGGKPGIC